MLRVLKWLDEKPERVLVAIWIATILLAVIVVPLMYQHRFHEHFKQQSDSKQKTVVDGVRG